MSQQSGRAGGRGFGRSFAGGRNGGGRGRFPRTFRAKPHKKLDSNKDVHMIKFGTNTNYVVFKEKLDIACFEKYGNLGRLIESNDYWESDKIIKTDYKSNNAEEQAILTMEVNEDVKERRRTMNRMKNDRPNMYAYVDSKLSIESE